MSVALQTVHPDERLDLIDALLYGDAFDCAVTLDELWRYGRRRIDRDALRTRLRDDPVLRLVVLEQDGLYCLRDRSQLLASRAVRMRRAGKLQRRAKWVAPVLLRLPFVRGLALTGSAAADDAGERADLDLLVIVEPGRIATVFLVLGSASRVLGRRLFCPNYYVRSDRLGISPGDLYVARELAQARGLAGTGAVLPAANSWLSSVFPNAFNGSAPAASAAAPRLRRALELPLRGRIGAAVERFSRRVAAGRLRAHYAAFGNDVPADVGAGFERGEELRFHAGEMVAAKMARYAARRAEVAALLHELDAGRVATAAAAR